MHKKALTLDSLAFPIAVVQNGRNRFAVTYGKQTKSGLTYAQTAREFGECVFHALVCDSLIDNR